VLFQELVAYPSPFDFMTGNVRIYQELLTGYSDDMQLGLQIKPEYQTDAVSVIILPDEAWARRVSGVLGNELANLNPSCAHAIFSHTEKGDYQISVRAPLTNKIGADELCSQFPTGGGRKSAAGINHLPLNQLSAFISAFEQKYR
jgi:hypothetical protein